MWRESGGGGQGGGEKASLQVTHQSQNQGSRCQDKETQVEGEVLEVGLGQRLSPPDATSLALHAPSSRPRGPGSLCRAQ